MNNVIVKSNYTLRFSFKDRNLFVIDYHDEVNKVYFKKIVKYSIHTKYNFLLAMEYKNYKKIGDTTNKDYSFESFDDIVYVKNISIREEFSMCIKHKENESETKYLINLDIQDLCDIVTLRDLGGYRGIISQMVFMVATYDEEKISFDNFLHRNNTNMSDQVHYVAKIMKQLNEIYLERNFIHGDFKIDNILIKNEEISFIDLEFSHFFTVNNHITVMDENIPRVNLYLGSEKNVILTKNFLHIFDIYLFTISLYSFHLKKKESTDEYLLRLKEYLDMEKPDYGSIYYTYLLYKKINTVIQKNTFKLQYSNFTRFCSKRNIEYICKTSITYDHNFEENSDNILNGIVDEMSSNLFGNAVFQ